MGLDRTNDGRGDKFLRKFRSGSCVAQWFASAFRWFSVPIGHQFSAEGFNFPKENGLFYDVTLRVVENFKCYDGGFGLGFFDLGIVK